MYSVTSPVSCVHKCVVYLFFVLEVLLDMSASGSELGWLTLPYENGVSIHKHRYAFKVTKQRKEKKDGWKWVGVRMWNVSGNNKRNISALSTAIEQWNEGDSSEVLAEPLHSGVNTFTKPPDAI